MISGPFYGTENIKLDFKSTIISTYSTLTRAGTAITVNDTLY